MDPITEQIELLFQELANQASKEGDNNSGILYTPRGDFSDTPLMSLLQEQFRESCSLIKTFIGENDYFKPYILFLRLGIHSYLKRCRIQEHKAMKHLLSPDIRILAHQISMLALHACMQNVEDIYNISDEAKKDSLTPAFVSMHIGAYTFFTILVNKHFSADSFDEIFIESWMSYFEHYPSHLMMFRMNGNTWKESFKGVLLENNLT